MKRRTLGIIFTGTMLLVLTGYSARGIAEVNINIGINTPPPAVVFPAPPAVVVIPRTYVYFVPDVAEDIFFYQGYWYRPYKGYWYRSGDYKGPWVHIVTARVPGVLLHLPPDFRHVPPGHERIPYGQLKKNWRTWEKEKYWDKYEEKERYKEERREHREGKGRGKHRGD